MSDSRTKNAARNIVFGFLNKFVSLILPFVTRTLILHLLGKNYLGIGTLFSSILSFLSLTELGVGAAIVYSMYKPMAEKDDDRICALLNFYKNMYRLIGVAVLVIGTVILPFVPMLTKGDAPAEMNIYILYYLYLINSVISYFCFGYKRSILVAAQRSDITSNINTVIGLVVQIGQVFLLYLTRDFYVYAFAPIVGTVVNNLSVAIVTKKKYPQYTGRGTLEKSVKKEILDKITGLFGTKLNTVVVHSSDVIVLSAFMGLGVTAMYGNYHYIMSSVCGFVMMFFSSMTAGIGNKIVTDTLEESYNLFKKLSFVKFWIVGLGSVAFLCLYEPFMKLWMGNDMKLGLPFVICMALYFFVYEIQRTIFAFKDAVGLWQKDKLRPYVSMAINMVGNLVLVNWFGVSGVVIATMLSFLLTLPWINSILFKNLFTHVKPIENLIRILKYFIVTLLACVATYLPSTLLGDSYLDFGIRILMCLVIPNVIFALIFFRTPEFKYFLKKMKGLIKRR